MNEEGGSGKRIVYCLLENEKRIVKDKRKFLKRCIYLHMKRHGQTRAKGENHKKM